MIFWKVVLIACVLGIPLGIFLRWIERVITRKLGG